MELQALGGINSRNINASNTLYMVCIGLLSMSSSSKEYMIGIWKVVDDDLSQLHPPKTVWFALLFFFSSFLLCPHGSSLCFSPPKGCWGPFGRTRGRGARWMDGMGWVVDRCGSQADHVIQKNRRGLGEDMKRHVIALPMVSSPVGPTFQLSHGPDETMRREARGDTSGRTR